MSLNQITDKDIEAERKAGQHKRGEKLDDCLNRLIIGLLYFFTLCLALAGAVILCVYLRWMLGWPAPPRVIGAIETIATHVVAGVGGYIAHLAHRGLGKGG